MTGQNLDQQLGPNQSLRLSGSNPVYAEQVQLFPPDGLDQFDQEREHRRQRAYAYQYVSPDMIGAGDLDDYGDWQPPNQDNQGYGAVWYPRRRSRWLDPLLERPLGLGCSLGLDLGGGRAVGFCALPLWPLGQLRGTLGLGPRTASLSLRRRSPADLLARPGSLCGRGRRRAFPSPSGPSPHGSRSARARSYHPWYHASPAYCNRVNVTNIYNTNVTEVHNTYINRTVNVYNTTNVTNVTYVNRNVATVVVPQHAFASGQSIAQAQRVQLTPQVRAQFNAAPIVPHPLVTPSTAIVAKAAARAVPPVQARPVVETRQGFERAGSPGTPVRAPQPPAAVNRPGGQTQPTATQPINRAGLPATAPAAGHRSGAHRPPSPPGAGSCQ